jgi:hypothetical protein
MPAIATGASEGSYEREKLLARDLADRDADA